MVNSVEHESKNRSSTFYTNFNLECAGEDLDIYLLSVSVNDS